MSLTLPELHPAQQGLKRCDLLPESGGHPDFQNYIQHNKDWNSSPSCINICAWVLPELHPAQQGLKLNKKRNLSGHWISSRTTSSTTRIETLICEIKPFSISRIQNYIQHNKDWNITRRDGGIGLSNFQNYIQHNKDWNLIDLPSGVPTDVFQNYIQHNKDWNFGVIRQQKKTCFFQNYIQHNKDWN